VALKYPDDTCTGTPSQEIVVSDFDLGAVANEAPFEFCVDHTGDDVFQDAEGTYAFVLSTTPDGVLGGPQGSANCNVQSS